jgi:hypothetical protein
MHRGVISICHAFRRLIYHDFLHSAAVAVTEDGKTAVFTDLELYGLGFVDITVPSNPQGLNRLSFLDIGDPMGVAIKDKYALAAVGTYTEESDNYSGCLVIVDMQDPNNPFEVLAAKKDLGGWPVAIFVSPDKKYAAVLLDTLYNDGIPSEPGIVLIYDISADDPVDWSLKWNVALTGLPGLRFDTEPSPKYASFDVDNILVVTLQVNNAIVQINATDGKVLQSHHAGAVNLKNVDLDEDKMIIQTSNQDLRRREPDGVVSLENTFVIRLCVYIIHSHSI